MKSAAAILSEAQALPAEEREFIAERLLAGLHSGREPGWHGAWTAELEQRSADAETDFASWPTAEDVLAAAQAKYAKR
jgi:hypothetical protein